MSQKATAIAFQKENTEPCWTMKTVKCWTRKYNKGQNIAQV